MTASVLSVDHHNPRSRTGEHATGLVDELHLMIGPAFLGAGTPALKGRSPVALRLLDSRTLDGSELVLARYDARSVA
ncbi:MAG: dihydrofolate reductase family protein [Solirubrobacteraceae bacterium]